MSIRNNSSFFWNSITEGWTKKDLALNLIPLGGIVSVVNEIGSAYFSPRDRTPKISQDFLKSPIETTLKKIAQCLWFPIIALGALKTISLIVNSFWNRCFPTDNGFKDVDLTSHPDIFKEILSHLDLSSLGVCRRVSTGWKKVADDPIVCQSVIYRKFAFSSENWAQWDPNLVKDVNIIKEMLSLPANIVEELRFSAFPGKSIRETHVLVRMPKGLTLNKLGELAKQLFPNNVNGYGYISAAVLNDLGDKRAKKSVWLLMTRDVLAKSRNKNTIQHNEIISNLPKPTQSPYKVPKVLEVVTCIFAEYFRSKTRLFRGEPLTYTRCKEQVLSGRIIVGGFAPAGLCVDTHIFDRDHIGVAALRKF